jgi:hypothetical protein
VRWSRSDSSKVTTRRFSFGVCSNVSTAFKAFPRCSRGSCVSSAHRTSCLGTPFLIFDLTISLMCQLFPSISMKSQPFSLRAIRWLGTQLRFQRTSYHASLSMTCLPMIRLIRKCFLVHLWRYVSWERVADASPRRAGFSLGSV